MKFKLSREKFLNALMAVGMVTVLASAAAYVLKACNYEVPEPTTEDINLADDTNKLIVNKTLERLDDINVVTEDGDYIPKYDFETLKSLNSQTDGVLVGNFLESGAMPVVHASDYGTYLNTPFAANADPETLNGILDADYASQNTSTCGTLFLDPYDEGKLTDQFSTIYGHNLLSNEMFGGLANYQNQQYADENPNLMYYTENGEYKLEYVCINEIDLSTLPDYNEYNSSDEFAAQMQAYQDTSISKSDIEISPEDKVVGLVTCTTTNPEITKQSPERCIAFFKVSPVYTLDMNNTINVTDDGVTIENGQDFSGYQDYTVNTGGRGRA